MVTKSGVWRRTSGITVAREADLSAAERFEGLGRLVRQVMVVSLEPRGAAAAGGAAAGAAGAETSGPPVCETRAEGGGVALPPVSEWVAVKKDCDPVARVCAKVELAQARLSVLTKEYCGLTTREVCDAARVARVKPAVRARVMETALACWGRPGAAAQLYCLRGGFCRGRRTNCGRRSAAAGADFLWNGSARSSDR